MDLGTNKSLNGMIVLQIAALFLSLCGTSGAEVCDSPLVSSLPPASFRSSSQLSNSHGPGYAKVNRRDGAGGWSPLESDTYQWLQVDLGGRVQITAVATQGRYGSSDWLTAYLLMFSDTGHNWKQYRQEDSIGSFAGNSNADSVVQYKLQQPVKARYLRLIPLDWNPNGRIGLRLEAYGCPYNSDVVNLDGRSSLTFRLTPSPNQRWSPTPYQSAIDARLSTPRRESISLKFKTLRNSGMLIHAEGEREHSLTLELHKGQLLLHLRQGKSLSSPAVPGFVSVGSLLDDQHWHQVALERVSGHLNLTVDKTITQVQVPLGQLSQWEINQLSVGGVHSHLSPRSPISMKNFHGCMENVMFNNINLIQLSKQNDQRVTATGNVSFSCFEPVSISMTFSGPLSFLWLPWATSASSVPTALRFQFRTWNGAGLLVTFDLANQQEGGVVYVYLRQSRVRLTVQKGGRMILELNAGSGLNDGQWHTVELTNRRGRLTLSVDKEDGEGSTAHASPSFPFKPGRSVFFGGCPPAVVKEEGGAEDCRSPINSFQGCMRLLALDNQPVDLIMVQQRLLGNYSDLHIDMCGIMDRCSPSHCEHGGRCSQSWSTFHCNCSNTGYRGATCHSPVYAQSCEAYKHRGQTSGLYYIDVDGSGPIQPQQVYCNMTDKAWMVIQHNNSELTKLRPSPGLNQQHVHFNYSANERQLLAVISQSDHCQQELAYHCRKSRLLNTPDGVPLSWWLGGPGLGQVQTYWGGAVPHSQQCLCGLEETCLDHNHYCNCDADYDTWTNDSGLLTHTEHLPVRSVVLGDIQRPGSEAAYRVGPLQCHGDKNFWNAAFFNKETSYLHFPTFHGELSADISFLFKTTASSGVFLENLGIKDFIRIELSSPSTVLFSFDVGDGPLEVRVEAPSPLDDGRWHQVWAERNVKEASLRVDLLPPATLEMPDDGHISLQLNSQLFVGGTASRQKGFLGCIRSLQLNGQTLDLEERAKITPGVRPGCPGHCSSYGYLCQNQGGCVERYKGFICDCGMSAYTGTFCQREVSASFKPGTSVIYTFQDPYSELTRNNISDLPSSIYSDMTLRGENVSLGFRTHQSPALLLYITSYYKEYLAVSINRNGNLDVSYKLQIGKDAEVLRSSVRNLANGQPHTVDITRVAETVTLQIDQNQREEFNLSTDVEFNAVKSVVLGKVHDSVDLDPDISRLASLGFSGCLSVVQFNTISPLKAALLYPDTSPVTVTGPPLAQSICGSSSNPTNPYAAETTHSLSGTLDTGEPIVNAIRSDSALIGGVIAVVIFVLLSVLAIVARFLYQRKETFHHQDPNKSVKRSEDSTEFPFNAEANSSQNVLSELHKEYFI